MRARAYTGLIEINAPVERPEVLALIRSDSAPLQKVGLRLLADQVTADDVPLLISVIHRGTSRAARLASDALLRRPTFWTDEDVNHLVNDEDSEVRRRAWWLRRQRGGWHSLIVDLEILSDPDPRLANNARNLAAPAYAKPTDAERERLAELLTTVRMGRERLLSIAIAAGLRDIVDEQRRRDAYIDWQPADGARRRRWWRRNRPT